MKNEIIKDLIPLYKSGDEFLIALIDDIPIDGSLIEDCLTAKVNSNGTFYPRPWSGQKMMKFSGGDYDPILPKEWIGIQRQLFQKFSLETLKQIKDILLNPSQEALKSLIYLSPRLKIKTAGNMEKSSFLQLYEVEKFIDYIKTEINSNLEKYLNDYHWPENSKDLNFEKTYLKFEKWRNDLSKSLAENNKEMVHKICKEILEWGGVGVATKNLKRIDELIKEKKFLYTLHSASELIKNDKIEINKISIPANSGFSKIYACLYDRFIIYDSRVAARMCFMISQCFNGENPILLGKAAYQAKGNRDPGTEFPMISGNDQKYFESNMKASWIIEKLAIQNPRPNYSLEKLIFAYQTALFVLGKEIPVRNADKK